MNKPSWQTLVVGALAVAEFALAAIAFNEPALGVTSPWLTLVLIPTAATGLVLASNQLKAIGSGTPPLPADPPKP